MRRIDYGGRNRTANLKASLRGSLEDMTEMQPAGACLAIILAAGEGTRMKSQRPKVLHEVAEPLAARPRHRRGFRCRCRRDRRS